MTDVRRTFPRIRPDSPARANFQELSQPRHRSVSPTQFERTHTVDELVEAHGRKTGEELEAEQPSTRTAGRILAIRSFGKANFLVISDGRAKIQVYIRKDALPERDFAVFKLLDFGDFVGVEGRVFRTKTNELTIWASSLEFLAKCFLPLPEKWHGLTDVETRYRQRYLDLIVNPDSRRVFEARKPSARRDSHVPQRPRLPRGRDADDAADRRRRAGAAVRDASQRARHAPVPAHRAGAVPEAPHRSAASSASTRSTATSATRGSRPSTTPSSRCSSSTRPTATIAS